MATAAKIVPKTEVRGNPFPEGYTPPTYGERATWFGKYVLTYPFQDPAHAGNYFQIIAKAAEWTERASSDPSLLANASKIDRGASQTSAFLYSARVFKNVDELSEAYQKWKDARVVHSEKEKQDRVILKAQKNMVKAGCDLASCASGLGLFLNDAKIVSASKAAPGLGIVGGVTSLVGDSLDLVHDFVRIHKNVRKYENPNSNHNIKNWSCRKIAQHTCDAFKRVINIVLASLALVAIAYAMAGMVSPISSLAILILSTSSLALSLFTDFYGEWLKEEKKQRREIFKNSLPALGATA